MYKPKISVITVCFNSRDTIQKTLASVVSQTYPNIEYLIIDGSSTDGTIDIIKDYLDYVDIFISERDKGIYDAMNKGIRSATGEWVIFMNAGDFFVSNDVLNQVVQLIGEKAVVVYGDIIKQCDGYFYYDTPAGVEKTASQMPVFHQSTFVRLSYHITHLFDIRYKSSGDYDFFYNSYFRDKVLFQYIPVLIACFDNTGGISKDNHSLSMRENLRIWKKEHELFFRLKLGWSLFIYSCVKRIKQSLLKRESRQAIEIRHLERCGKKCFRGVFPNKYSI